MSHQKIPNWIFLLLVSAVLTACGAGGDRSAAQRLDLPETGSTDEVLFSQRCHDCHVPPRPQDKPAAAWPAIVQRMQSHRITNGLTPLSAEELRRIMGYLQRNARDAT
jgi:hypothetical protein